MNTITLELKLPEEIYLALQSAGLSRDDLGTHAAHDLAAQLYAEGRLSFGKAAKLANLSQQAFWAMLSLRGLPVFNYTDDDYEADLEAIGRFADRKPGAR